MRIIGKNALITSAENLSVEPIAAGFAREGANCVIVDRDASKASELAAQIRSGGRRALPLQLDVAIQSQVEEAVARAVAEFGHIDVLLNCSVTTVADNFFDLSEEPCNACLYRC